MVQKYYQSEQGFHNNTDMKEDHLTNNSIRLIIFLKCVEFVMHFFPNKYMTFFGYLPWEDNSKTLPAPALLLY